MPSQNVEPKMRADEIKNMWSKRARTIETNASVTHADVNQRRLEIHMLSAELGPEDVVLDVGCGNGWATAQMAPLCAHITGMDYSEEMIARARKEQAGLKNADWRVGDVLSMTQENRYDVVTTVRCLINIIDAKKQRDAIGNLHKIIKPGGRLLMMEGLSDGRSELSRIRTELGLGALPNVPHNLDFPIEETLGFLRGIFSSARLEANGIYDLCTRALYPKGIAPQEPKYNTVFHDSAAELSTVLPALPGVARFGMFVCVK